MQSAVLWLHNVHLDSTLHGGFKPLLSLCGFKPLGFREVSFILALIYPDPRLVGETRRAADWYHGVVQAPKGRGKGFTYGQHEADKRKREGNTYTRVTDLMRLKTINTKTCVMIGLEVWVPRAVLEFGFPPAVEGQAPRWVAWRTWLLAVRKEVARTRDQPTALSRCSLPTAFSLYILVQSRLSAVRAFPFGFEPLPIF